MTEFRWIHWELAHVDRIHAIERASFTLPWPREAFVELLDPSSAYATGAMVDARGEILGYVVYCEVADELQILNIAVDPSARKRGVGARMLETLHRQAIANGRTQSYLEVRETNAPAIALYEKFGYKAFMRRPKYYPDTQEDALLMRARLVIFDNH